MDSILFLVPPNINFEDFINPPDNVKTVLKNSKNFGSVITDIPLGVLSLSAYIKRNISVHTSLIDFNVEINKIDDFRYNSFIELYMDSLSKYALKRNAPTIIAISVLFSSSYRNMLVVAN